MTPNTRSILLTLTAACSYLLIRGQSKDYRDAYTVSRRADFIERLDLIREQLHEEKAKL